MEHLRVHSLFKKLNWSGIRGSNSLPQPWQGCALPDELIPHKMMTAVDFSVTPMIIMVPSVGIEPTTRGFSVHCSTAVSYTHLDVYKRQILYKHLLIRHFLQKVNPVQ